uniref:Cyclin-dependent kinase inhibitor 1D n=1 Tax=Neogobius melanostomus TaxID=47308 RepID=A0A8C6UXH9_9GOBI
MASPSASTSAASNLEMSRLGGIEALRLKVGPVKRNLFGPVDHQQLQQDFQRLLHMGVELANKRWNFDFQRDTPGPGSNIEWEELSSQEVPAYYSSCIVRPARMGTGSKRRYSSSSGEGSPVSSNPSASEEEYFEVTTRECYRLPLGKRRQASITDFFRVKKRRLLYKESSRQ